MCIMRPQKAATDPTGTLIGQSRGGNDTLYRSIYLGNWEWLEADLDVIDRVD